VSVYGLGRFPVTLYKEQWAKLLSMADEIREFIKENEPSLKAKPEG
jgi:CRISPR/Cas system-associated exonuclease Cas4 (RecB family)